MDKPVLGVCRGMQSIGCFFGARLRRVNAHVGGRHSIEFMETSDPTFPDRDSVNSYHQFGFFGKSSLNRYLYLRRREMWLKDLCIETIR